MAELQKVPYEDGVMIVIAMRSIYEIRLRYIRIANAISAGQYVPPSAELNDLCDRLEVLVTELEKNYNRISSILEDSGNTWYWATLERRLWF